MKIKTKLTYSLGSLLIVIIMLGTFSAGYIYKMKLETQNILADNYNSVRYARQMQTILNSYPVDSSRLDLFEQSLSLQQKNITEINEGEVTDRLVSRFEQFRSAHTQVNLFRLSQSIDEVVQLNMNSIYQKSQQARATADMALGWIIALSLFSAVIALIMLIRFPRGFTRPIKELTEGILEISNQNYDSRLVADSNSEFGQVAQSFNSMAEQLAVFRKSTLADIMAAKQYLETIINSIDEPIIGLNGDKKVLFVNNAALRILNVKESDLVGHSALDISLRNDLFRRLIRSMEPEDKKEESLKIYSNNKESYFQVHYIPIADQEGTVILLTNITEFKELDNAKTNFISTISHELKTPISAIMMSLKLLEDERIGEMNEEQKALSQSIKDSSDRLLSITSELLKMTQVETGKLQLCPKVTKPIELIEYAVNATRVLAERFGCNIEVEYPQQIAKLFIDSEKIAWVITNLLSNAIHYSHENARIIVGATQREKRVDIYVQDFGKGIDPRYHQSIFDRYFRVPGTKVQGSGLGLAISKDFVEAHAGTIRIDSQVGQGSRFTISIPIL